MNQQRVMLADTVTRLFRNAATAAAPAAPALDGGEWDAALWAQVEEIGLPLLLAPEDAGGVGGSWEDAYAVLHQLGHYAIGLPVAEAMLAGRLLGGAGLALPDGALTVAPTAQGKLEYAGALGWQFTGKLAGVPWGAQATHVVASAPFEGNHMVVLLSSADAATACETRNLAGEPRHAMTFDNADVQAAPCALPEAVRLYDYCALLRVAQTAGALEAALLRSIEYARQRKQFGKPIGNFQAVQQQLALLGNEAAAAACAARIALRAADRAAQGDGAGFEIAAAKLRCNLAINTATAIAHQVHGAIGFTHEYDLRQTTQRLWSWRTEFGNDRYWSGLLGASVVARGADRFWSDLTGRGDPVDQAAHTSAQRATS